MAAKYSRHVALTAPLVKYLSSEVEKGRYASASEVVRAAIRLLMDQDEAQASRNERSGVDEKKSISQ